MPSSLALRLRELAQLAERDHDATGSEAFGHYAEQLAELATLAEHEAAITAALAAGAEYVLENDDDYIGEEFAEQLREALAGRTPEPEPEPERDENGHEWRGAFCSRCGADEAGSFAAAACEPDHEEPEPVSTREALTAEREEEATSDRLVLATLEVAAEKLGELTDWRVVVDGVAAGEWPATLETRCWGTGGTFATFHAAQNGDGEQPHVRLLGEVRTDA